MKHSVKEIYIPHQVSIVPLEDFLKEMSESGDCEQEGNYGISLVRSGGCFNYDYGIMSAEASKLMFFNPHESYIGELQYKSGYSCTFKEDFFSGILKYNLLRLPMFTVGGRHQYILTGEQDVKLGRIFSSMIDASVSAYTYKYELIRNYMTEIIHNALKIEQSEGR